MNVNKCEPVQKKNEALLNISHEIIMLKYSMTESSQRNYAMQRQT